jgi:hypothetical protein
MTDEATTAAADETAAAATDEKAHEETVAYERFQKVNHSKKAAEERAKALEKEMAELRAQMEERETAGLPELERERKRAEQLEKRIQDAERRAEEAERSVQRGQRERWVTAAAQEQNFADPSDAAAFVNLDEIEDEKDAQRAVKRLAAQKKHLLRAEGPELPGRVLSDGRREPTNNRERKSAIDPEGEAAMLADALGNLMKNRWQTAG